MKHAHQRIFPIHSKIASIQLTIEKETFEMPTVLLILGWRLFFYANEGNEPAHIHCKKGDKECKYWLDRTNFNLEEAYAFNLSPRDRREIKKIIFEHFEYLEQEWDAFERKRQQ